jgi:hypothetical protein
VLFVPCFFAGDPWRLFLLTGTAISDTLELDLIVLFAGSLANASHNWCAVLAGMALGHGSHAFSPENRFFFGEDPTADGNSTLAAARKGGAK